MKWYSTGTGSELPADKKSGYDSRKNESLEGPRNGIEIMTTPTSIVLLILVCSNTICMVLNAVKKLLIY